MDSRLVAALRKTPTFPDSQLFSDHIDLSNACRAFYQSRLESHKALRERLASYCKSHTTCSTLTRTTERSGQGHQTEEERHCQCACGRTVQNQSRIGSFTSDQYLADTNKNQDLTKSADSCQCHKHAPEGHELRSRELSRSDCRCNGELPKDKNDNLSDKRNNNRGSNDNNGIQRRSSEPSPMDAAMHALRQEMASLMEKDLSLMKQLLTLNEEIEELKWRRRYFGWGVASSRSTAASSSAFSFMTSSGDVLGASVTSSGDVLGASVTSSEGWFGESRELLPSKYPGISSLSLHADCGNNRLSVYDEGDEEDGVTTPSNTSPSSTVTSTRLQPSYHGDISNSPRVAYRTVSSGSDDSSKTVHVAIRRTHKDDDDGGDDDDDDVMSHVTSHTEKKGSDKGPGVCVKDKFFIERESFDSGIHEGYTDSSLPRTNSKTEMTHL